MIKETLKNKLMELAEQTSFCKELDETILTEEEFETIKNCFEYFNTSIDITEDLQLTIVECDDCNSLKYYLSRNYSFTDLLVDNGYGFDDEIIVCDNCYTHYSTCCECNCLIRDYDAFFAEDRYGDTQVYCDCCFNNNCYKCELCGEYFSEDVEHYTLCNGEQVCSHCSDRVYYCEECHNYFIDDDTTYDEESDTTYCNDCYNEMIEKRKPKYITLNEDYFNTKIRSINESYISNYIMSGYHKPYRGFNFLSTPKDTEEDKKRYIGFELEITDRYNDLSNESFNNSIGYIQNNFPIICEGDSSIKGRGIELISDAITLNGYKLFKSRFATLFSSLIDKGFTSDKGDTQCGLHFHISREFLGDTTEEQEDTIARIELILENFKSELIKFSRKDREAISTYSQFLSDKVYTNTTFDYSTDKIKESKNNVYSDRYQALNLSNDKTIEFRFFKGSLNIDTFYASLYLVNNIIELAKDKNNYIGTTWKQLINKHNYKELIEYNQKRDIISKSRLKDRTETERKKIIKKDLFMLKTEEQQKKKHNELLTLLNNNESLFEKGSLQYAIRGTSFYSNYESLKNRMYDLIGEPKEEFTKTDYMLIFDIVNLITDLYYNRNYYTTREKKMIRYFSKKDYAIYKNKIIELKKLIKKNGGII